jgi:Xaa-Pro aminopeptidase
MADAAVTVSVGSVSDEKQNLISCAERAFDLAVFVARAGNRVFEIGRVIEREVRRCGFSVIRELCGHGIGRTIHENPSIPNFAGLGRGWSHGGVYHASTSRMAVIESAEVLAWLMPKTEIGRFNATIKSAGGCFSILGGCVPTRGFVAPNAGSLHSIA